MKKQIKNLIIMLASVLVIGIVALAFYFTKPPVDEPDTTDKPQPPTFEKLFERKPEELKYIEIKNESDIYTIAPNQNSEFELNLLKDAPQSYSLTSLTAGYLASPRVKSSFKETDVSDLNKYGLDSEKIAFTVCFKDIEHKFIIGSSTPSEDGYYMLDVYENIIYIAPKALYNYVTMSALEYVDSVLIPTLSEESINEFEYFTIKNNQTNDFIKIVTIEPEKIDTEFEYYDLYKLTSPINYSVNDYMVQTLFSQINGLTATEAVSYDMKKLSEYGLDNPLGEFTLVLPNVTYNLKVSNCDGTYYYAYEESKDAIYKLAKTSVPFFTHNGYEYARRTDILPNIDSLDRIKIETQSKTYLFVLTGKEDGLMVTLNSKPIDSENFRSFYINLISMSAEGGMPKPENLSDPYFKLTYVYRDSSRKDDVIEYFNADGRKYFRLTNNDGYFYVLKDTLDLVISDLNKVATGQTVSSDR